MNAETFILGGLTAIVIALQLAALLRRSGNNTLEQSLREEQRVGRDELRKQLEGVSRQQEMRLEVFSRNLSDLANRIDTRLNQLRESLNEDSRKAREESAATQQRAADLLGTRLQEMRSQLDAFGKQLSEENLKARSESRESLAQFNKEVGEHLHQLTQRNEARINEMRGTLEQQLQRLQTDNANKLEQMRVTVDEKLQGTLNQRLDSSFKLVSERLEQVQRGLGEMQQLATGVGDLKRVLSNVKTRGSWGEVQLENLLEQTLTADQYARSVKLQADSSTMVDFAVRLPGRDTHDSPVWLPIDSKFPHDAYERLLDAQEQADAEAVRIASAQLESAIHTQAKSISGKYIAPPHTTDFAVMFLPTEGLYAEVIRRPGLVERLQREHRIVIAGPTTLTALLNSLQMGFRTLAIEQRSSEVRALLGAVKGEFGKFATILEKAEKQINTVGKSLGEASRKTRTIERKMRNVEALSSEQSQALLGEFEEEPAFTEESEDTEA